MILTRLVLVLVLASNPSLAIYPSGTIKLHNAKLISHKKDALSNAWLKYLEADPKILYQKDKDYKIDQYCSYTIETDPQGSFVLDSIKLLKHKNNIDYNLKTIQFLRERKIKVKQKNSSKPIEIEFIYSSF